MDSPTPLANSSGCGDLPAAGALEDEPPSPATAADERADVQTIVVV